MKTIAGTTSEPREVLQPKPATKNHAAFAELEQGVHTALETYSNVHRGSGHNSLVSTQLYEQAREIVLESLGLDKDQYVVIFCTPRRAELLKAQLKPGSYQCVSSQAIGLPLGLRALAVKRQALPGGVPFQTGGGTARLVSPGWVIWAHTPDKFEAGTPAIVNVIALARALRLIRRFGNDAFQSAPAEDLTAAGILYHDELEKYSGRELLDQLRQTLIGGGCWSQPWQAPGRLSTWTTAPVRPLSNRYGMRSARPGALPGRYSKTSFGRSGRSAPIYWARRGQPMTCSLPPIPPKPSTWQPKV